MDLNLLTGLTSLAFVISVPPGPNNFMLMVSGANFSLRRILPHSLGVVSFSWHRPRASALPSSFYPQAQTATSALVFGLINFPSVGVWAIVGQRLRGLLQGGRRLCIFNLIPALLQVRSLCVPLAELR
jgi:threonine/homoserine/homoserine lactone efflux protein